VTDEPVVHLNSYIQLNADESDNTFIWTVILYVLANKINDGEFIVMLYIANVLYNADIIVFETVEVVIVEFVIVEFVIVAFVIVEFVIVEFVVLTFVLLTVIKEPIPPVISIYHGNVELVVLYAPNLPELLK